MNEKDREVGSLESQKQVRAGASGKDLDGVEGMFLGGSAAQCKGKPERFKYPRRTQYLSLCYLAFCLCYFILG